VIGLSVPESNRTRSDITAWVQGRVYNTSPPEMAT
jgi:hypothetical protein